MGKADFDNLMKVIKGTVAVAGTAVVSLELDFELPRGFIAKIHKVIMMFDNLSDVWTAAETETLVLALLRDPDDITTTSIPINSVEHDVIVDHQIEVLGITGAAGQMTAWFNGFQKHVDFTTNLMDVITARNMRLNVAGSGTELNNASGRAEIYYTLEKVTDIDILNLLDIL